MPRVREAVTASAVTSLICIALRRCGAVPCAGPSMEPTQCWIRGSYVLQTILARGSRGAFFPLLHASRDDAEPSACAADLVTSGSANGSGIPAAHHLPPRLRRRWTAHSRSRGIDRGAGAGDENRTRTVSLGS